MMTTAFGGLGDLAFENPKRGPAAAAAAVTLVPLKTGDGLLRLTLIAAGGFSPTADGLEMCRVTAMGHRLRFVFYNIVYTTRVVR